MLPESSRQLCIRKMFDSMLTLMQSWPYAMLCQRLQATFHRKKFRQFSECRLNNIWSRSLHMSGSGPSRQKRYKVIINSTFYPATSQTFSQTLSKKVYIYVYICIYICVTVRNEETKSWYLKFKSSVKTLYKV